MILFKYNNTVQDTLLARKIHSTKSFIGFKLNAKKREAK